MTEAARAYNRAYYLAHRETAQERSRERYVSNREAIKARSRAWELAHPEEKRERSRKTAAAAYRADPVAGRARLRARYAANPERARAYQRAWSKANPEKARKKAEKWRLANQDRRAHIQAVRRARQTGNGGSHTMTEWLDKCALLGNVCFYCGESKPLTRDHKIPLSRGGTHDITNILPACKGCNSRKHSKTAREFLGLAA